MYNPNRGGSWCVALGDIVTGQNRTCNDEVTSVPAENFCGTTTTRNVCKNLDNETQYSQYPQQCTWESTCGDSGSVVFFWIGFCGFFFQDGGKLDTVFRQHCHVLGRRGFTTVSKSLYHCIGILYQHSLCISRWYGNVSSSLPRTMFRVYHSSPNRWRITFRVVILTLMVSVNFFPR